MYANNGLGYLEDSWLGGKLAKVAQFFGTSIEKIQYGSHPQTNPSNPYKPTPLPLPVGTPVGYDPNTGNLISGDFIGTIDATLAQAKKANNAMYQSFFADLASSLPTDESGKSGISLSQVALAVAVGFFAVKILRR